jgi:hypothetical protein
VIDAKRSQKTLALGHQKGSKLLALPVVQSSAGGCPRMGPVESGWGKFAPRVASFISSTGSFCWVCWEHLALALVLASIGAQRVVSQVVSPSWREIALRMAAGPQRRMSLYPIVGQGVRMGLGQYGSGCGWRCGSQGEPGTRLAHGFVAAQVK